MMLIGDSREISPVAQSFNQPIEKKRAVVLVMARISPVSLQCPPNVIYEGRLTRRGSYNNRNQLFAVAGLRYSAGQI